MSDDNGALGTLVGVAALAGVGYATYRYVYLPWAAQQELERRAAAYQAQHGGTRAHALDMVSQAACVAIAAKYGGQPAMSVPLCGALAPLITDAVRAVPAGVIAGGKAGGRAVVSVGRDVGAGAKALVQAPGKLAKSVVRDTKKFFSSLF